MHQQKVVEQLLWKRRRCWQARPWKRLCRSSVAWPSAVRTLRAVACKRRRWTSWPSCLCPSLSMPCKARCCPAVVAAPALPRVSPPCTSPSTQYSTAKASTVAQEAPPSLPAAVRALPPWPSSPPQSRLGPSSRCLRRRWRSVCTACPCHVVFDARLQPPSSRRRKLPGRSCSIPNGDAAVASLRSCCRSLRPASSSPHPQAAFRHRTPARMRCSTCHASIEAPGPFLCQRKYDLL